MRQLSRLPFLLLWDKIRTQQSVFLISERRIAKAAMGSPSRKSMTPKVAVDFAAGFFVKVTKTGGLG
jgi:hypothetical protein